MGERQGCRSASIQGDTGVWVKTFLHVARSARGRMLSAWSLVTAGDCLLAGSLGAPSFPGSEINPTRGSDCK